jgi:hypothetical protein
MKENINENNTFTKYEYLKLKSFISKFDFDLLNINKDFNPKFILSCYEVFFRRFIHVEFNTSSPININSIEENFFIEAFKNLDKIDNLFFILEKYNNDNYNFKLSYNKNNKEIFYLKGYCKDNYLFTIEEFFTEDFFKLNNTKNLFFQKTSFNFRSLNDKLFKNFLEDFKIITEYDNNVIIKQIPLSKNIIVKGKNYLLEDNIDENLFNRYYFYNDDLLIENIMYVLLRDEYFIRFYYDVDKKIYERTSQIPDIKRGKNNLSTICIDYLKRTNKSAEEITENDLNIISIMSY